MRQPAGRGRRRRWEQGDHAYPRLERDAIHGRHPGAASLRDARHPWIRNLERFSTRTSSVQSTLVQERPPVLCLPGPWAPGRRLSMTPASRTSPETANWCRLRDGRYWARASDPQLVELEARRSTTPLDGRLGHDLGHAYRDRAFIAHDVGSVRRLDGRTLVPPAKPPAPRRLGSRRSAQHGAKIASRNHTGDWRTRERREE
jgi:hypothetical protein